MVRIVLFDIDGTLAQTSEVGIMAYAKTLTTEFNLKDSTENMNFAGRTDMAIVREFFKLHGLDESPAHFRRFFSRYVFWLDHIVKQNRVCECPGARRFIEGLLALPEPPVLGLLTGNIRQGAEIKLRRVGLWELFSVGAFAEDHEDRNQIALAAWGRLRNLVGPHLQPEEVVVVGDTPADVRCGKFIGAKTIAVATGGSKLEELSLHGADLTLADLTQISASEAVSKLVVT